MWRRSRRVPGQWEVLARTRFGHAEGEVMRGAVWVHAVSLGETRAAQPLVAGLLAQGLPVLLTHMTATGRAEGARLFGEAISQGQLRQAWLPYDFPRACRRFFDLYAPRCGLIIEREIWPNLLAAARAANVPMALVSARFSARSLRASLRMGRVMREAMAGLQQVLAQTPADAQRLAAAGARAVTVTGNLKFDVDLPPAQCRAGHAWREAVGRPVVAIASTREGEDALFLQAMRTLAAPRPLYLLIPRHPQRFDQAWEQAQTAGFKTVRRSALQAVPGSDIDVVVGDTLGEMPLYYAAADVAIIGGSFVPLGGQNLIEACAVGTPVVTGQHTFNFEQATRDAIEAGAAERVHDARQALQLADQWVGDPALLQRRACAARTWTQDHKGAVARSLAALQDMLAAQT
ncbi:3-deoxy-D-manno-octulosonic acid transferase [Bordetella holmesii]|nr:3-deoxy-D-manno-octulosonic acid transferase [Bordetella holmesii]AIT25963.1 3-Deoxy-D-manno-octulosonic-acid transferase family protein [Bordetella holmesii 44057]EWM43269.1 3-Deoxy-D-manno-octulosonic-acid transferase family protein [Bordetella holmesii 41130]EWM50699.1 3-Deoxy-D-manno-octulosonic-acid transferase family protein [Bordetella holmesii 70147]AMD45055.1 3-deoxy-D-manno-octulosonic acid transferase [Bordetella holmesii H558]AOB37149.1 3-deoxy-D-manno-octulosonic acid transfera